MSLFRSFLVLVAAVFAWSAAWAQQTPAAHPGAQAEVFSEPRFSPRRPPSPPCELPAAPAGARIVLLDGYRGQGLSSVAVGASTSETRASSVTIEAGDEPLYLVLTAEEPMVWQFDGAVERVAKAVLVSKWGTYGDAPPAIGATGLARDTVAFSGAQWCSVMFTDIFDRGQPGRNEARRAAAVADFKRLVGRAPDSIVEANKIWKLHLPSGAVESVEKPDVVDPSLSALVFKRRDKGDFTYVLSPGSRVIIPPAGTSNSIRIESPAPRAVDELREALLRDFPGAVVHIDPASVVSPAPVAAYEVLPKEAGLVQLLESGAIMRNRKGEYLVKRKIRYPAGLDVKFVILNGVPMPDGDRGRSTVVSEDTGGPYEGSEEPRDVRVMTIER